MFDSGNYKFVVAITGGGSEFISDRLVEGGASSYLLEATIPYSQESLKEYVNGVREKFCSDSTARQMAMAAHLRGIKLGYANTIGIGASSSLTKPDGEREGRDHRAFVSVCFHPYIFSVSLDLNKLEIDGREQQERYVAESIYALSSDLVMWLDQKNDLFLKKLRERWESENGTIFNSHNKELAEFIVSDKGLLFFEKYKPTGQVCVYSGSFNPYHEGHQYIFDKTQELFGKENVYLELAIVNHEKGALDTIEIAKRIQKFSEVNFVLCKFGMFVHKAMELNKIFELPPIFPMGYDTFKRIEKWTQPNEFLVFPRNGERINSYEENLVYVHPYSYKLGEGINISSSEIRANNENNQIPNKIY